MYKTAYAIFLAFLLSLLALPASADDGSWVDRVDFKGDIRLRYERIDEEFDEERNRMRFRTRFGFTVAVEDNLKVVLQMATGGDNPVSTNQTLDDGFTRKDLRLDLAYVDWKVNDSLTINAGKFKNPLFRAGSAPLIWDGDLNPEGFAAKYKSGNLFATAAAIIVEERGDSDDSMLYAGQVGATFAINDAAKLTAGVGYFTFTETAGNSPFFNGRPQGNSVDVDGNYIYDYKNAEAFAEFATKVNDWPLKIFAQYTQNTDVSEEDTALAFGARLGSAKDKGQTEYAWVYQDLEADAVIGTFSDSDFGGGGTDSDGHIFRVKHGLSKKLSLAATFFLNDIDAFQGTERDYNRLQVDVEIKFD